MSRKVRTFAKLLVFVPVTLILGTGCLVEWAAASGGIGYLLGRLTAPTVTVQECYLNGQPVDCSTVP